MSDFESTEWTDFLWSNVISGDFELARVLSEGVEKIAGDFKSFSHEVFYTIYTGQQFDTASGPDWARRVKQALSIPEIMDKAPACRGLSLQSGILASRIVKKLVQNPPSAKAPDMSVQSALEDLLQDATLSEEQCEKLLQLLNATVDVDGEADVEGDLTLLREALREAAIEAVCDLSEAAALSSVFAGTQSGASVYAPGDITVVLARAIRENPRLQEIIKMAGKLQALAKQSRTAKARKGSNEVAGVELGFDLGRLLPSELVLLTDPLLEAVFARKLQEKTLSQYLITTKPEEDQGPVILLLDVSGTMRGNSRGTWASAVALAFYQIAREQKRDVHVVSFNSAVVDQHSFLAKEPSDAAELLSKVSLQTNGGTSFIKPLKSACECVKVDKVFKNADIIMLTDGEARIRSDYIKEFNKFKAKTHTKLYTISMIDAKSSGLDACSDEYISLPDFIKEQHKLSSIFSKI